MAYEHSIQRYRRFYSVLLRLYPRPYYERYGEGMEQTFRDILREGAVAEGRLLDRALWMFVETSVGIMRENTISMFTQKRTFAFILAALALLIIPFLAMQFRWEGWDWKGGDFAIMAVLLTGAGIGLAAATNSEFSLRKRIIGLGIVGFLFLLYVHLAVGIVDTWPLAGS
jgi:hypothetical protein